MFILVSFVRGTTCLTLIKKIKCSSWIKSPIIAVLQSEIHHGLICPRSVTLPKLEING